MMMIAMPFMVSAQDFDNEEVDRSAPDFVTASLCISDPGEVLYSSLGHAFFRMQCPTYDMDNCYSFESEDVSEKVLTFLMGKLKMGLFNIRTKDFLDIYREEGRPTKQYQLNLPPDVKQELWRLLDEEAAKGPNQLYDYNKRCCAQECLRSVLGAAKGHDVTILRFPEETKNRRMRIVHDYMKDYPWNRFFFSTLVAYDEYDRDDYIHKIIIPNTLVELLQNTEIDGHRVITHPPTVLLESRGSVSQNIITPSLIASIFVILSLLNFWFRKNAIDIVLLSIAMFFGFVQLLLIFCTDLPCLEWSWILVGFNPLPLFIWKWRHKWAKYMVVFLCAWILLMALHPQRLVDWSYTIYGIAYLFIYVRILQGQMSSNSILSAILGLVPSLRPWRWEGDICHLDKSVMIAAPHTSYMDAITGKRALARAGIPHRFLSKNDLFHGPFGWMLRKFGCIPVGGVKGRNSINDVAHLFSLFDKMHIVICPEGTRQKTTKWNPGFVYMAQKAGVPIVVLGLDYKTKTLKVLDVFEDTSDARKVIRKLPELYKNITARHPEMFAVPEV